MEIQVWFWLFYVLGLLFSLWVEYVPNQRYPFQYGARNIFFFVLIVLLGWKLFGSVVK
jgi:hypothetical protein